VGRQLQRAPHPVRNGRSRILQLECFSNYKKSNVVQTTNNKNRKLFIICTR
jgi:hypothetical protein